MKFSIRSVLAATTLIALSLLAFLSFQRSEELNEQIQLTRFEIAQHLKIQESYAPYEERIQLYHDHLATLSNTQIWFDELESDFAEKMAKYGTLNIEDPSQFLFVRIPTFNRQQLHNFRWRIYVPDNLELEFRVQLLPDNPDRLDNPGLVPDGPMIHDLPAGESTIAVTWDFREPTPRLQCKLNDVEIVSSTLTIENSGGLSTSQITSQQQATRDFGRKGNLRLLKLAPSESDVSIWFTIEPKQAPGASIGQ